MNKYIVPVCDLVTPDIWLAKYSARSLNECQDKIMREFSETFGEEFVDYREFLDIMDRKYNHSIGDIIDIETL